MTDAAVAHPAAEPGDGAIVAPGAQLIGTSKQRELTLLAIMFVLGAGVSVIAPQLLSLENFSQVAVRIHRRLDEVFHLE